MSSSGTYESHKRYDALIQRTLQAFKLNRWELGGQQAREAIALDIGRYEGYRELGRYYYHKKDYERAEELVRRALSINATDSFSYRLLGDIYSARRHFGSAIEAYETALSIRPDDAATIGLLSQLQLREVDMQTARATAHRALSLDHTELTALKTEATIHIELKDYRQGAECLRRALRAHPMDERLAELKTVLEVMSKERVLGDVEMQHRLEAQIEADPTMTPQLAEKLYDAYWGQHWVMPTIVFFGAMMANLFLFGRFISRMELDLFQWHLYLGALPMLIYCLFALAFSIHTAWEPVMMSEHPKFKRAMSPGRRLRSKLAFFLLLPACFMSFIAAFSDSYVLNVLTGFLWTSGYAICFLRVIGEEIEPKGYFFAASMVLSFVLMHLDGFDNGMFGLGPILYVVAMISGLMYGLSVDEKNQFES